jgi:hypothetical protein
VSKIFKDNWRAEDVVIDLESDAAEYSISDVADDDS